MSLSIRWSSLISTHLELLRLRLIFNMWVFCRHTVLPGHLSSKQDYNFWTHTNVSHPSSPTVTPSFPYGPFITSTFFLPFCFHWSFYPSLYDKRHYPPFYSSRTVTRFTKCTQKANQECCRYFVSIVTTIKYRILWPQTSKFNEWTI